VAIRDVRSGRSREEKPSPPQPPHDGPENPLLEAPPTVPPEAHAEPLHEAVAAFKRELIVRTLEDHGGNRSRAAAALRIERTSLLRLIRELGIRDVPLATIGRPMADPRDRRHPGSSLPHV
jgi:DNA-binding NtrC family response regulator